jgi:hypothetical protein
LFHQSGITMAPWLHVLLLSGFAAKSSVALSLRPKANLPAVKSKDGFASRRQWLYRTLPTSLALAGSVIAAQPEPAAALVKGSVPPPKTKKAERGTCRTIDECEAVGSARSDELFADSNGGAAALTTPEVGACP